MVSHAPSWIQKAAPTSPKAATRRQQRRPGCGLPAKPRQPTSKNSEGWQRMGEGDVLEIQISLIRPVLLSAPGTSAGLDISRQIFLRFCFALPTRPSSPSVCHIYPPLALYKVRGTSLEYDRVERPGSRSQTARHDLPPKRYLPYVPFPLTRLHSLLGSF